ncbi:caspase family protein [Microvirga lotononidis]|uniref:Caspase domain-containing protein n=1 Tax=Microvirga lotononidis TaxID=864069 RepID=I4Z4L7_9HYPH|nr:caspase family protein [Microvirga lotononidis]EIM31159.1 Caspase domain-containing protein [Microvirga lotononidis]WQO30449.1 caspase family protein [Microvirga lotononidis]
MVLTSMLSGSIQATAFGDLTRAVLVGVSNFEDKAFRELKACAPETERLGAALTDPAGCRIPDQNVDVVVDARATLDQVIPLLQAASSAATPDQILIIYFAGHGEKIEGGFGLILHDTRQADLARTALTSAQLDRIFSGCRARGLLIILDCCGGAALAENAPAFMQRVGQHDFRILLSASRVDQSSWETSRGSVFTKHLIDVVEGTTQVSATPGQVYFNDLLRHLRNSVAEEIANAGGELPPQEPVFNGGYIDDPLIFVHTGETLKQIRVKVQRYSQSYVRARIRFTILLIVSLLLLGLGGFWLVLDQHYFLQAGDRSTAVYHGYPGLSGLGYPKLLWAAEVQRNFLKPDSPLVNNETVVARRTQPPFATLLAELSPAGQSMLWVWAGQKEEARRRAKAGMDAVGADRPNDWAELAQLFAANATAADIAPLEVLSRHQNVSVVQAALRALARLKRTDAVEALSRRGFDMNQAGIHVNALKYWDRPCDDTLRDYLNKFQRAMSYKQFVRATLETALDTQCTIDLDPLLAADRAYLGAVATYWATLGGETPGALAKNIQGEIAVTITRIAEGDHGVVQKGFPILDRLVEMGLALPKTDCPVPATETGSAPARQSVIGRFRQLMAALDGVSSPTAFRYERTRLAAYLAATCKGVTVILIPAEQPGAQWSIALVQGTEQQIVMQFAFNSSNVPIDAIQLAEYITAPDQAAPLQELAAGNLDAYWKSRILRKLRLLKVPAAPINPFFSRGEVELQVEAYLWQASSDHEGALRAALARLNDPTAEFLPALLTLLDKDESSRAVIMRALAGAVSDETRRTALITLFGTKDQVAERLASPQSEIRAVAIDYLQFRDDLLDVAAVAQPALVMPTFFSANFTNIAFHRSRIRADLASTPDWAIAVRSKLMLDTRNDLSSGLRLWIDRETRRRTEGLPLGSE